MQRVSEIKRVIFTFIYDYSYDKILGKFIIIICFDKKSKWNEQNEFRSLLYRILRKILKFHYNLINIKYFIFTIYHDRLLINFDKSIIHYCLWLDLQFTPDNWRSKEILLYCDLISEITFHFHSTSKFHADRGIISFRNEGEKKIRNWITW